VEPPEELYHGTAERFVKSIRKKGLVAKGRNFVHLSSTKETAMEVGRRHGRPVVLVVKAKRLYDEGNEFYHPTEETWLTKYVPPDYILFPKGCG